MTLQYNADGIPMLTINPSMVAAGQSMQGRPNNIYSATAPAPVLANTNAPTSQGALSPQQGRRANTMLSVQRPDLNIGTNEMLMRVGGAGLGGAQQGGLQAYSDMLKTYGGIQDQNRANSMTMYNADYRAEQAELDRQARIDAAKIKAEAKNKQNAPSMPQQSPYMTATLNAIDAIEKAVAEGENDWVNPFDNVTGLIGAGLSLIPGTPAYDTNAQIETVVSSIGFDRLQRMRDESPTGGALGQVSERELAQLNASLGNLRQSQSRESFKRNLALVKQHYMSAVEAIRKQQIEYARMNGLPVPASAQGGAGGNNQSAADAIVGITN